MGEHLKGKVAIITGSGQGTGRAIATGFAAEGAKVITNNRKPISGKITSGSVFTDEDYKKLPKDKQEWFKKLSEDESGDAETTAHKIREQGGEATACFADISVFDDAKRLVETAIETYGRVDIIVNVAGSFGFSPFTEISEELWDRVNNIKPKGYFNVMRHAVPYMIKQGNGGRIINCTSRAFMGDVLKHAEYCAANAGVVGLTRGAAIELKEYGITCNAFGPWARTRAAFELDAHQMVSDFETTIGNAHLPTYDITPGPERIVPFLTYLASDASSKINGSVFTVGGEEISLHSEPEICKTIIKADSPWTVDEIFQQIDLRLFRDYKSIAD